MADNHFESGGEERVWDEYDWERFLQQQDRKTEKYMELLEKYIDDPNRDQIIAREMGWHHLLDENGKDWSANLDNLFSQRPGENISKDEDEDDEDEDDELDEDEDFDEDEDEEDAEEETADEEEDEPEDRNSQHPLYQAASALAVYVDQLFRRERTRRPAPGRRPADDQRHPGQRQARRRPVRRRRGRTRHDHRLPQAGAQGHHQRAGRDQPVRAGEVPRRIARRRTCADGFSRCATGSFPLMGHYRNEWRRRYGQGH